MKDILLLSAAFIGAYACFMGICFLLGKMLFPFYTEKELGRRNALSAPRPVKRQKDITRREIRRKVLAT